LIKILLAEDHNIVRNGIKSLLEKEDDMEVIAEAGNGREVLEILEQGIIPDIILSDMNMPEINGLALVEHLKQYSFAVKVLILSMLDHENYVLQSVNAGANGYILKNVSQDEMVFAIRHIMKGNLYICSEMTSKILAKRPTFSTNSSLGSKTEVELSKREAEVLALIAEGFTNNEIAERLFMSRRTVEGHRQNLLDKTDTKNTATLIRFALRNELIN